MSILSRLDKLEEFIMNDHRAFVDALNGDITRIAAQATPEQKEFLLKVCAQHTEKNQDPILVNQLVDFLEAEVDPAIRKKWSGYFRSLMGEFRKTA